jgi:FkbM family methyltransferase
MIRWDGHLGECRVGWAEVEALSSQCELVVDVGANIGACTLHAALAGYRVIAIEASPTHIDMIQHSLRLNNLQNRVKLLHTAISAEAGLTLNFTEPSNTAATRQAEEGETVSFTTTTSTISEILKDEPCVRLFKIDCEGCEYEAIKDLLETGMLDKIDVVKIEINSQFVDSEKATFFLETLLRNRTVFHTDSYDRKHRVHSAAHGVWELEKLHTYDLLAFKTD